MAGLQSKFQNLNAKVNQNVDRRTDTGQTSSIQPKITIFSYLISTVDCRKVPSALFMFSRKIKFKGLDRREKSSF